MVTRIPASMLVGGGSGGGGDSHVFSALADEAIAVNQLVYIKANGRAALASAATAGKEAVGVASSSAAVNQSVNLKTTGSLITGLAGLTPNTPYFMGSTPGAIVPYASAPTQTDSVLMRVGIAMAPTVLLFAPEEAIIL